MNDRIKLLAISVGVLAITLAAVATYDFADQFLADKALRELQDGEWVIVATGWGILLEMWYVYILFSILFVAIAFFAARFYPGRKKSK